MGESNVRLLALDTETHLMRQGCMAPRIVCVSWACGDQRGLVHHTGAEAWLDHMFASDYHITTANGAYDMACIGATWPSLWPRVWAAYEAGRIHDVLIRQKLQDIARGCYRGFLTDSGAWVPLRYNLADVSHRYTHERLAKGEDTWRLRYAELENVPLDAWPAVAVEYAIGDAVATLRAHEGQDQRALDDPLGSWYHVNERARVYADFCLHLTSCAGIMTSPDAVARLQVHAQEEKARLGAILQEAGFLVGGVKKRSKVQAYLQELHDREGLALRYTEFKNDKKKSQEQNAARRAAFVPQIVTDEDACLAANDPLLDTFAEYVKEEKLAGSTCEAYARGAILPLHTHFEVLAATGRTTSSGQKLDGVQVGCNIQNIGTKAGLRECFIPRPGNVFVAADYDAAELRGLAQVCKTLLGRSRLAEILNSGVDPHLMIAAQLRHTTYEQAVQGKKDEDAWLASLTPEKRQEVTATHAARAQNVPWYMARQSGKVANFGFPGGMGHAKMVLSARKQYGVLMTEQESKDLKAVWQDTLPEMYDYFRMIDSWGDGKDFRVEQLFSGRLRSKISYCSACNSPFQGIVADMALNAVCLVSHAMHAEPESPLYGTFLVNFVHDELIAECPEARCHEAAEELARLMVVGASPFLPDVPPKASPVVMRYWSKSAKALRGEDGRLIAWPREA